MLDERGYLTFLEFTFILAAMLSSKTSVNTTNVHSVMRISSAANVCIPQVDQIMIKLEYLEKVVNPPS
jgi:hypothetical protein